MLSTTLQECKHYVNLHFYVNKINKNHIKSRYKLILTANPTFGCGAYGNPPLPCMDP